MAILSVLAFHLFPGTVRGGFVGVDVFFVISGYLITGIIFKSLTANRFSFRQFYARRIRRIFPALALVMGACLVMGWFVLLQGEYMQLSRHVVAASAFFLNFVLWREAGYFDNAAALKPLQHLWSLGIEEQFYIVWPLVLWIAWRRRINLRLLTLAIIVISFGYSLRLTNTNAVAAFYSPFSRFWELAVGCALALTAASSDASVRATEGVLLANLKSVLGGLLVLAAVAWGRSAGFPGWWALLPTLGTGLLISAGPRAWFNRRVLSHGVFVSIGLVSYPLYLWHWPLLSFARIQSLAPLGVGFRVCIGFVSVVLAWLTFKIIERPARRAGASIAVALVGVMVVVFSAGVYTYERSGFPDRYGTSLRPYATFTYAAGSNARPLKCWLNNEQSFEAFAPECIDSAPEHASRPLVFIWGDSYAARLYVGMNEVHAERYRFAQFTRDGCAPIPRPQSSPSCQDGNRFILKKIDESKPAVVVLFADWAEYAPVWPSDSAESRELLSAIASIRDLGVPRIVVVGPAPRWEGALPRLVYQAAVSDPLHRIPKRLRVGVAPLYATIESNFKEVLRDQPVSYFSVRDLMCDADGCLTHVGTGPDQIVSFDNGHFTATGAAYVAKRVLP